MPPKGSVSERRSAARTAVIWDALGPLLGSGEIDVLDIGGGTGVSAVRVAELGHRVTVVDPSPDALAALARRAQEAGVADRIHSEQGDLADLPTHVPAAAMDLVLCHGVLEVVDDVAAALAATSEVLRPGGSLSLLVEQHHAAVVARALAGHFGQARALLTGEDAPSAPPRGSRRGEAQADRRYTEDELATLLAGAGYTVDEVHGVRVFADLVPGSLLEKEPGATQALVELEQAVADRPEYRALAAQLHVLAHT